MRGADPVGLDVRRADKLGGAVREAVRVTGAVRDDVTVAAADLDGEDVAAEDLELVADGWPDREGPADLEGVAAADTLRDEVAAGVGGREPERLGVPVAAPLGVATGDCVGVAAGVPVELPLPLPVEPGVGGAESEADGDAEADAPMLTEDEGEPLTLGVTDGEALTLGVMEAVAEPLVDVVTALEVVGVAEGDDVLVGKGETEGDGVPDDDGLGGATYDHVRPDTSWTSSNPPTATHT